MDWKLQLQKEMLEKHYSAAIPLQGHASHDFDHQGNVRVAAGEGRNCQAS